MHLETVDPGVMCIFRPRQTILKITRCSADHRYHCNSRVLGISSSSRREIGRAFEEVGFCVLMNRVVSLLLAPLCNHRRGGRLWTVLAERGSYIPAPAPGPAPITNKDGYLLDRAIKNVLKVQVFHITHKHNKKKYLSGYNLRYFQLRTEASTAITY